MKILVFGAGVLGCNLARNFFRAGKDVTLLARGNWAAEIQKNGLRIKDKFLPHISVSRIPVVTELKPDDAYDVIFVVLRYTQLDSILETLRANPAKSSSLSATMSAHGCLPQPYRRKTSCSPLRFPRATGSRAMWPPSTSRRSPSASSRAIAPTSS